MNEEISSEQVEAAKAYQTLMVPALFGEWAPRVAEAARIQPGDRVLDLACGTGVLAGEVARHVGPQGLVVGVDPAPGMLAIAREREPALDWRLGIAESLPIEDESLDVVVSQFGLMFFDDREKALSEVLRVLRPGGRLAIAVWDSLDRNSAYLDEVRMVERLVGVAAANAIRAPFVLGDRDELAHLFDDAGVVETSVTTSTGTGHFSSVRKMVEADLRGWLPLLGIELDEDVIELVLHEADRTLVRYVDGSGRAAFDTSAHIVTGTRRAI